jgi:hypothetical protein
LSTVPIALAVATTAAVVAIALAVIPHGGGGAPGQPRVPSAAYLIRHTPKAQLQRELQYVAKAAGATAKAPPCAAYQNPPTRLVSGTPNPALRSALPVLGRPATAGDTTPHPVSGIGQDVLRGATRRLVRRDGMSYYIVPTRTDPAVARHFAQCQVLQRHALRGELVRVSPRVRADTLALQAGLSVYASRTVFDPGAGTFCTVVVQGHGTSTSCGLTLAALRADRVQDTAGGGLFLGVVPARVASVTIRSGSASFSGTTDRGAYVIRVGRGFHGGQLSHATIWRDADGHVIKRFPALVGSAGAAQCDQHPLACLIGGLITSSGSSSGSGTATASASATR